jgi:hypothetical protein
VPYESGTLTANDYNLNIDFDNGESRHNDGERDLSLVAAGLAAQDGAQLARWPGDEPPLPSECHALPYGDWLLFLPPDGVGVDDAFCVFTSSGRYGYFEVRDREITEEGDLRWLTVTFMVWSNPSDL